MHPVRLPIPAPDALPQPARRQRATRPAAAAAAPAVALGPLSYSPLLPKHCFLRKGDHWLKVRLRNILYIEAADKHCLVTTAKTQYLTTTSLCGLLRRLPADQFVQIHRCYLINVRHLACLDATQQQVTVAGRPLALGRHFREGFLLRLRCLE